MNRETPDLCIPSHGMCPHAQQLSGSKFGRTAAKNLINLLQATRNAFHFLSWGANQSSNH
jgi:hypothetical protein